MRDSLVRRKAKVDANQSDIVDALRACGCSVFSLASVGKGCPDLVIARAGKTYLAEIKNGKLGWKWTPTQKDFHSTWKADILVFDSVQSVEMWARSSVPDVSREPKEEPCHQ